MSTSRVDFTRAAAERIANAVRIVETGDRDGAPLRFGRAIPADSFKKIFRVCTFTGQWAIGSDKVVTFKYQTSTPNTAQAQNLFLPLTVGDYSQPRDCAIAKEGTAWYLIQTKLEIAHAATAASVTTAAIEFHTLPALAFATASTHKFTISVSTCATAS